MRLPPKASSADSPPVEPPGEYLLLCGLLVRPQTSLVDSKERSVVGRFVFTKGTAPVLVRYGYASCTGSHTCVLQQPDHGAIFGIRLPRVSRIADRDVKALDLY